MRLSFFVNRLKALYHLPRRKSRFIYHGESRVYHPQLVAAYHQCGALYGIARRACVWNPPKAEWNHHEVMYEKGGDRRYAPFASPCRRSASYRRSAAGNRTLCAFRAKWVLSTSARQKRKPPKRRFSFLVDPVGIEPMTSALRTLRSPS